RGVHRAALQGPERLRRHLRAPPPAPEPPVLEDLRARPPTAPGGRRWGGGRGEDPLRVRLAPGGASDRPRPGGGPGSLRARARRGVRGERPEALRSTAARGPRPPGPGRRSLIFGA